MIELGGNIELVGFKDFDSASLIVVKKIVGNYARRFSELSQVDKLTLSCKKVHERESSSLFEVQAKLSSNGSVVNADVTDRNLFFAIDAALKKIEQSISK
ncbi:hypothetical protein D6764_01025 [Candidatus Woesearchaeota archaeon]|nr:MAG: hypothetical protein D6764_01025 [Candidatus Woesearchaeota archaeon]